MSELKPDPPAPEHATPAGLLERVRFWLASSMPAAQGRRVELFHRVAVRVRVAASGMSSPAVNVGREEGIALRLRDRDGQREGLAAAGCGPDGVPLAWLLERAAETAGASVSPWRDDGAQLVDVESDADLPSAAELEEWLAGARRALAVARGEFGSPSADSSAWVEAALTTESLVHDGGLATSRARLRVWAAATFPDRAHPDSPERPRVLAARRIDRLDPRQWGELFEGERDRARAPVGGVNRPLAFEPEAAAALVAALVPVLHGPDAREGTPVGLGWGLVDDPLHPNAMVGGIFDDAGFASRAIALAGEGRILGRLEGPGSLRRASYRDRPEALPSLIVVAERRHPLPDEAWTIRSVRIHASGTGPWVVELDGTGGDTGAIVRGARLITAPERLAAACTGSFGTPRQAGWGVITPGLILEGLRVEG